MGCNLPLQVEETDLASHPPQTLTEPSLASWLGVSLACRLKAPWGRFLAFQEAKANLDAAAELAVVVGSAATDAEVATYNYWRGRVLWAIGGEHRSHRSSAHAAFLATAGESAPAASITTC